MKVLLAGKNSDAIRGLVESSGLTIVDQNPEVIISFGGDGTLLYSEREYPSIPKLPVRNSQFCHKCPEHDEKVLLEKLHQNKLTLKSYRKLQTEVDGKTLYALNEFSIRNAHPTHAIRFRIHPPLSFPRKRESINNLFIGDGIVVSTLFGSTAYFKSITGKTFDTGFGLAFNNTTEIVEPIFLEKNDEIKFELVRNIAQLSSDNNPDIYDLHPGSNLTFNLSDKVTKIYSAESLRCPNCQVIRG